MTRPTLLPFQRARNIFRLAFIAGPCLAVAFGVGGCSTKKQTYNAPDPAEVREKTREVKEGIRLSRFDVAEARKHIETAQKTADQMATVTVSLLSKVDELAANAPIDLQKPIAAIRLDVVAIQADDKTIVGILIDAWQKNAAAAEHLAATDAREVELEQKQREYYANAWKLADNATELNAELVEKEKKLSWYRWHWWGSWIALGLGLIACIVAALLKWGAKWSGKIAAAGARASFP